MKIYEIGTGYTPIPAQMGAATEIVVEELTRAFLKQGVPAEIIDIAAEDRAQTDLPIREVKVPKCFSGTDVQLGIMHKLKRVVYSVALAEELKKILKKTEEKVVLHFHNQYNLFFFLKLTSKKIRERAKIVYTVHSYIWPDEWDRIKDVVRKRYFQEVYCVQNADCVLVLNEKTTANFVKHLNVQPERIHMIGNGVNTDHYCILEENQVERFKETIGLGGKKVVFQVGSVCDRKNQLGSIMAMCQYLQNNLDVVYVYAGGILDAEYQAKIRQFAQDNSISDQVVYAGELSPGRELNQYYNAAEVTVFPSKIESFGLVVIESLAAGTPVILADEPFFLLDGGYSVYRSKEAFIELIEGCIKRKKNSAAMRSSVVKTFGWEKIAEDHLKII